MTGADDHGQELTFKHPAVQSAMMFLGEFLCLVPFFIHYWRSTASSGGFSHLMHRYMHRSASRYAAQQCEQALQCLIDWPPCYDFVHLYYTTHVTTTACFAGKHAPPHEKVSDALPLALPLMQAQSYKMKISSSGPPRIQITLTSSWAPTMALSGCRRHGEAELLRKIPL